MDVVDVLISKDNPLDQDLILKQILTNVGKADLDDLLDCRLVNHRWNRVAVQILEEQHGYAIELDYKKLLRFKSLLWKTQVSRSAESELSGHEELVSLRLSLDLLVLLDVDESQSESDTERANQMGEVSQLLLLHPQLQVAFISCFYGACFTGREDLLTNHELFNVLKLTSLTLRRIKLRVSDVSEEEEVVSGTFEKFNFEESYLALEFPRLTSLHYKLPFCFHDDEMVDTTRHALSIIKRAPHLTKLHLKIWEGNKVKSNSCLEKLIQPALPNLEELKISLEDSDQVEMVVKLLCKMKFPKLAFLKLGIFEISASTKQFFQHLKTNCLSLSRFEISSVRLNYDVLEELVPTLLPNIRQFGFYVPFCVSTERRQEICFSFRKMMDMFPNVNVMSLDIGFILNLGALLREAGQLIPPPDKHLVFPSVLTLEVQISSLNLVTRDFLDIASRYYRLMFPNINRLVVVVKYRNVFWNSDGKEKLVRAIGFLCSHPGIQQIEIQNFTLPLFQQIGEPKVNLQGVKSLKLLPPKSAASTDCSQFNLPMLLAKFPALEFLQFGKAMVYESQIQTVRSTFKLFQNPISKYKI